MMREDLERFKVENAPLTDEFENWLDKLVKGSIPDPIKQHAIDLQNIVGLLYTGYPSDDVRNVSVSRKEVQRLIHLEKALRKYLIDEIGLFWETEYLISKRKS